MAFDTVNAIAKIKGMETCSGPGPRQNRHKRATGTCFINCSPELPQVYRSHRQQPRTRHEATQRAIMFEHGRTYKIVNAKAGNVLDLSGSDNRSLIGWDWHGGHNQQVRCPLFSRPASLSSRCPTVQSGELTRRACSGASTMKTARGCSGTATRTNTSASRARPATARPSSRSTSPSIGTSWLTRRTRLPSGAPPFP